ncbi:hypothetical protein G7085_18275 [Tessaracoccus sp. HDW20]|uniref:FKBP-type peptidyl-prolyl cis-trans isomerase n=1 Tax=Tessaracoccus coleopterorum TaxID=2714950 RepID=UPI0018D4025F|nr:hypothetical protein [Tessaracoccus coleopterorum]
MIYSSNALRLVLTGAAAAALLTVTACGSSTEPTASPSAQPSASATPSASASPTPTATPSIDLSAISVSDADTPVVTFTAPWAITATQTKVLREATGTQLVTEESSVTLNNLGINGTTGETFDSSYKAGEPATFTLDRVITGMREGLVGQKVGSRVLIGIPAADAYPQGSGDGTINPGDSILFVADIISAREPEAVTPEAGLPTVTMADDKPEIAIPAGVAAPPNWSSSRSSRASETRSRPTRPCRSGTAAGPTPTGSSSRTPGSRRPASCPP